MMGGCALRRAGWENRDRAQARSVLTHPLRPTVEVNSTITVSLPNRAHHETAPSPAVFGDGRSEEADQFSGETHLDTTRSPWRHRFYNCKSCSWEGVGRATKLSLQDGVLELRCPICDRRLALIPVEAES
jgi:hypothetical protein